MKLVIVLVLLGVLYVDCARFSCVDCPEPSVSREHCEEMGWKFLEETCVRCSQCVDEDVVEVQTCEPDLCVAMTCLDQTAEQCAPTEALVPKDGVCFCCNTCMPKKIV